MIKGQKKQPEYKEGKPCRKCGTTKKLLVWRKHPNTGERYRCGRCSYCCRSNMQKKNKKNYESGLYLEWQRENREHLREYQREYYKGKYAARNAKHDKRIKERFVFDDMDEIQEFYRNCPEGHHIDHIVPLNGKNVSGLHTVSNLQYLPATENLRKSNKFSQ